MAPSQCFAIMWPRKPLSTMVRFYNPNLVCPPEATTCDNELAAPGCPEPTISAFYPSPVTEGNYFVTFTVPVDAAAEDILLLESTSGGYTNAEVVTASSDGLSFEVTITGDVSSCPRYFRLWNIYDMACSARVEKYSTVSGDATQRLGVKLLLFVLTRILKQYF